MNPFSFRDAFIVVSALTISTPLVAQDPQMLKGEVVKLDEATGTVSIRQEPSGTADTSQTRLTEEFGVKEGLLFNALKPGDKITFTVETVNGQKHISSVARGAGSTSGGVDAKTPTVRVDPGTGSANSNNLLPVTPGGITQD